MGENSHCKYKYYHCVGVVNQWNVCTLTQPMAFGTNVLLEIFIICQIPPKFKRFLVTRTNVLVRIIIRCRSHPEVYYLYTFWRKNIICFKFFYWLLTRTSRRDPDNSVIGPKFGKQGGYPDPPGGYPDPPGGTRTPPGGTWTPWGGTWPGTPWGYPDSPQGGYLTGYPPRGGTRTPPGGYPVRTT